MNKKEKNKDMIKILIAGGNGVGGVSFRSSFFAKEGKLNNIYHNGFDYMGGEILWSDGEKKKIYILCGGRAEIHRSITINYIKNVEGILLIYNITNQETFNSINYWMDKIVEIKGKNFPIVLIGNKCDLEYIRKISKEDGEKKAIEYGLHFYESSCLQYINIQEPVYDLAEQILKIKKEKLELKSELKINNPKNKIKNVKTNKINKEDENHQIEKKNIINSTKTFDNRKKKNYFKVNINENQNNNYILEKIYMKYLNL